MGSWNEMLIVLGAKQVNIGTAFRGKRKRGRTWGARGSCVGHLAGREQGLGTVWRERREGIGRVSVERGQGMSGAGAGYGEGVERALGGRRREGGMA